jgi:basic amino acid/polyamine antiporter, APA family
MQENLKRTIGVFGLACAVVNMTIGTGIFVLPALVAETLGAAAIICFFICGLLIFLIALCFASVGSKVTVSGGPYEYIGSAFGPYAGFVANITFLLCCVLSDAAAANALSKTLGFFWPALNSATIRPLFFFLLFGVLAFINIRGAKEGVRLVMFTAFAKLIPLLLLIAFGMGRIEMSSLQWNTHFTLSDIGSATLILFYAFLGIETAVTNGGEFKNPSRTVPLGILSGLSFVLLIYIAIQIITQGVLGTQMAAAKDAPLAAVSKIVFGPIGISIMVAGSAISMLGAISGEVLAIPRVIYAGARDGFLPKIFFNTHPKYATPHWAIIIYVAIGFLLAVFGAFKQLIILTSASTLLIYFGVVLSAIKLKNKKALTGKPFTIPGGIVIPIIAAIIIIWVLSNLSKNELAGVGITLVILSIIYMIMQWWKKEKHI